MMFDEPGALGLAIITDGKRAEERVIDGAIVSLPHGSS